MKTLMSAGKYTLLFAAIVLTGSILSVSAQTKKQQEIEVKFTDFQVKAEAWADIVKDPNGKEMLKNCKIKVHVKNMSGASISRWEFAGKLSRHTGLDHQNARYEEQKKPGNLLSNNSSTEIVFDTDCYMQKDSLKVYKK